VRNTFARVLTELAKQDERILLYYADIGNRLFNPMKEIAEERTINAGIAEANMASMAAGSAMMGHRPFIYTIAPFTTARNFEQIKIDIAYQNLPVVIVGTGAGLSYANLGPSHHSCEDIALMRMLPNMRIVCPADSYELAELLPQVLNQSNPVYFRIGKKNEPKIHQEAPQLSVGKVNVLQHGERIAVFSTGTIMPIAQNIVAELVGRGLMPELVSFHTVSPLDEEYLDTAAERFEHVITLETHCVNSGFGSAILEYYNAFRTSPVVHRFGTPKRYIDQVHSQADAMADVGLTVDNIVYYLERRGIV
jgi:transketolase